MRFLKKNARVLILGTLVITALLLVGLLMVPKLGKNVGLVHAAYQECGCKVHWERVSDGYGYYHQEAAGCDCDGSGPWEGALCEQQDFDTDSPYCSGHCWRGKD